jgi:hypothetical protein
MDTKLKVASAPTTQRAPQHRDLLWLFRIALVPSMDSRRRAIFRAMPKPPPHFPRGFSA